MIIIVYYELSIVRLSRYEVKWFYSYGDEGERVYVGAVVSFWVIFFLF